MGSNGNSGKSGNWNHHDAHTHLRWLFKLQFCKTVICRVSAMRAMFMLKTQFHDLLNMLNEYFGHVKPLHAIFL